MPAARRTCVLCSDKLLWCSRVDHQPVQEVAPERRVRVELQQRVSRLARRHLHAAHANTQPASQVRCRGHNACHYPLQNPHHPHTPRTSGNATSGGLLVRPVGTRLPGTMSALRSPVPYRTRSEHDRGADRRICGTIAARRNASRSAEPPAPTPAMATTRRCRRRRLGNAGRREFVENRT